MRKRKENAHSAANIKWLVIAALVINLLVIAVAGIAIYQSRLQYEERARIITQNYAQVLDETYKAHSTVDGIERLYSYRKISPYPIYTVVGLAKDDYLSEWRRETIKILVLLALFSLVVLCLAYLLHRYLIERKQKDEALKESEEHLKKIFLNAPVGIFHSAREGRFLTANPALSKMLGYSGPEELIAATADMTSQIYADPKIRPQVVDALIKTDGWIHYDDIIWRRKDNRLITVDVTGRKVLNAKGDIIYLEGFIEDITERKLAEEKLRHSEEKFRNLFNNAEIGMFRTRVDGSEVLDVNQKFLDIVGRTREETLGKPSEILWADQKERKEMVRRLLADGRVADLEFKMRNMHGGVRNCITSLVLYPEQGILEGSIIDITELKLAEEHLRKSENKYRTLIENLPQRIFHKDRNSVYISCNKHYADDLGIKPDEIAGRTDYDFFPKEFAEKYRADDKRLMDLGKSEDIDEKYIQDGQEFWVHTVKNPTMDVNGNVTGILGIFWDITAHKLSEEKLLVSEKRYRSLFDNMLNGFAYCKMLFDQDRPQDFIYLSVNNAFESLTGLRNVVGKKVSEVIPGIRESDADLFEIYGRVALNGKPEKFEKYIKALNMWFAISVYSPDKEYFVAVFDVITERKQTETALRESEERFRNAFEQAAIGFAIYTPDGRFLRVNQAMCKIVGYSEEELTTKTYRDITHKDDQGFTMDQIGQVLSGKVPVVQFPKRYIHKLGHEIWASVSVSVVRDDKGNPLHLISLIEDLTEKRKLEEQLRQAQKMEAIGQLAGGVAHDFNNILTAIMGYGSLALMNMAKDDPQRINIERMLEGSERASHLTNDLLLFSRKQISERKYVDLNQIIKKMEKFLIRMIGEDISCKTILNPGAIPVLADAHQLEQVMMNLATNARDAMPRGGVFSVATEQIRLDKEFITAHGYGQPGTYALMTVSDTGKGMDETVRQRIFEPFFTTKVMGKGTGLGMAVVYGIVKGHYGYINVYSEPELGTTFKIYLPMIARETEVTTELIQPVAMGKGETILIAEDEPQVREVLRLSLEQYGYLVIEAENGEDAVKQYKDNMEKVSLVLLDVIMPLKNGMEAYEEIKSLKPDTKVIFMSGYSDDIIIGKGLLEADTELIVKPIPPDRLLRKVREILDR